MDDHLLCVFSCCKQHGQCGFSFCALFVLAELAVEYLQLVSRGWARTQRRDLTQSVANEDLRFQTIVPSCGGAGISLSHLRGMPAVVAAIVALDRRSIDKNAPFWHFLLLPCWSDNVGGMRDFALPF